MCSGPPDQDLQKLFYEFCNEGAERNGEGFHNDEAVLAIIERNKSAAKALYFFPKYDDFEFHGDDDLEPFRVEHPVSALYIAVRENASFDVINALYKAYPEAVKELAYDYSTLLHHALTYNKSPNVVRLLLEEWPGSAEVKDEAGRTPLFVAIFNNAPIEVISLLLEQWPAAVKVKCLDVTPLYAACYRGASLEVISLLLEQWPAAVKVKCLDVTPLCMGGETPLFVACRGKEDPKEWEIRHYSMTLYLIGRRKDLEASNLDYL